MLPQIPKKQKCGIITTLVSSIIGLVYEEISSFLHHNQNKALHQAVRAVDIKTSIQHNKLMQLENSMLMYCVYNVETLEKLINTVHNIQNTSLHERLFRGQQSSLMITLCKFIRFTSLLHKFTVIFENSKDKHICTISGINNPATHIHISN